MNPTERILRKKEIQGIFFTIFGKILALSIMMIITIFSAKTTFEILSILSLGTVIITILSVCIHFLKKEKYINYIASISILLDILIVTGLPFIYYYSVGGDEVPRTYMVKTYTQYTVASLLILNAFTLRPHYPIFYSLGVVIGQSLILIYAMKDPRYKSTDDYLEAVLGNAAHTGNYVVNMFILSVISLFLGYLTYKIRNTILEAAQNEVKADRLSRYFSPNLVSELSTDTNNDNIFNGKVQNIIVIFTDLVGFTSIAEKLGPQKTLELLSDYHERMLSIVFAHQGTLDKFIGDGMLITFGTPIERPDDVERAFSAALEMQRNLILWSKERESNNQIALNQRIGIHYGEALIGNIGAKNRLEYTVIGDTVNTASRIESIGKELSRDFLISKSVFDIIGQKFNKQVAFEGLGNKILKGKSLPLEIYSVKAI